MAPERWVLPSSEDSLTCTSVPLTITNSLSRGMPGVPDTVPLVPLERTSDGAALLKWYICGPTVYDHSHLGHARTYVTFDIIRGLLEEYYNTKVEYCMNITDVDDKIINKANAALGDSLAGLTDEEAAAARRAATAATANEWCDKFLKDMGDLGVTPATHMPRVSQYIPKIVDFVNRIIANGYGYVSEGSVYFDVHAFRADHYYCKCAPWVHDKLEAAGASSASTEGANAPEEDAAAKDLAEAAKESGEDQALQHGKRAAEDFALWKAAKAGEPYWEGVFSGETLRGRPGWHIECSVMATDVLGEHFDIHAGGVDLRFPHHDNELAQSEAALNIHEWCRYFMHAGHLHIAGCKMSKSLKNFITIQNMLTEHSAAQIRFFFLQSPWYATVNYEHGKSMEATLNIERTFIETFHAIHALLRAPQTPDVTVADASALVAATAAAAAAIPELLGDNFAYHRILREALPPLLSAVHVYAAQCDDAHCPDVDAVRSAGRLLTRFLRACGFKMDHDIGFAGPDTSKVTATVYAGHQRFAAAAAAAAPAELAAGINAAISEFAPAGPEADVTAAVNALVSLRASVRAQAMATKPAVTALLALCDDLRDNELIEAGVRVEDGAGAAWKLEDPAALRLARDQERARKAAAAQAKADRLAAQRAELAAFADELPVWRARQYPGFVFEGETPVTDADGQPVAPKQQKKIMKMAEGYAKKHAKWLEMQ